MQIEIAGEEIVEASQDVLWRKLTDPAFLVLCIPGCTGMTEVAPDQYKATLELRVASVGGSFEGDIGLSDKQAPSMCRMSVSGGGTLGHGLGEAWFDIQAREEGGCLLLYKGSGEVGGLVAGVGQRVLGSVSKFLIGQFFKALRTHIAAAQLETA